jgi:hypothetical protein
MTRKRDEVSVKPRCVLDSGGVTALIGRSQKARAWLRWIVSNAGDIVIPTPVLVECTTGSGARDAEVNRILAVLGRYARAFEAPDEATARLAGSLRYEAGTDDGIDALVAAEAARLTTSTVLLTSDPSDLRRLLDRTTHVSVQRV